MLQIDSAAVLDAQSSSRAPKKRRAPTRSDEAQNPRKSIEIQPLPRWVTAGARAEGDKPDRAADAQFFAGAALARLDDILRSGEGGDEPPFSGALRQRLALRAATACATLCRLREDAPALRDAEHLAGSGETSPAGRLHRVFRLYASLPARLDAALARAVGLLGLKEAIAAGALANVVAAAPDPLLSAAHASAAAMRLCAPAADAEIFAFVVADLVLANRLGWARPVPLIAVAILHPSLRRGAGARESERVRRPRPMDDDWAESVARAYGLAVVDAHALAVDLARRADKLLAVVPALRARGARRVVDMLLADDAVTPAATASRAGLSDRAARRLFDRLVMLDAVRELTGRETFRIYGL